jgi:glycosyltransferase involved in cell wall biosynthesis
MIVKDEERFLKNCLNSVRDIVDEIIIVDTGSKDKTKELANSFGARLFEFDWKNDFSAARNFSLKQATSNWILVLDADEMIDDSGKEEIKKLINTKENCLLNFVGFKFEQRSYRPKEGVESIPFDLNELERNFDGYELGNIVRLFRNNPKIKFKNKVHELVEESIRENKGKIKETNIIIHHFVNLKRDKLKSKTQLYVDMMWDQLKAEPENPRYNRQVGMAFLEQGKTKLAAKYLLRTLKYDPNYPTIFADLGKLYVTMKLPKRAMKYFNMAIAKNKRDVSSINNLAVLYMSFEKFSVAQKLLEMAKEIEPDNKAVSANFEKVRKRLNE